MLTRLVLIDPACLGPGSRARSPGSQGATGGMLTWRMAAGVALAAAWPLASAAGLALPDQVFVQAGVAENAQMLVAGLAWNRPWHRPLGAGRLSLYWEASLGRWRGEGADGRRGNAWITQFGLTPVLRWQTAAAGQAWFVEGGIGANLLLPVYRSGGKSFSTHFNFGDHLALGRRFGAAGEHELALRLQHFSNGGIRHPNPGENFLQLRYAWRY